MAVAECPADKELELGYPLAGQSGAKWNELLILAGRKRDAVDLNNAICCKPPGKASGAYGEMVKKLADENKRRAEAGDPHQLIMPVDACRPRLMNEVRGYKRLIALGGTAAKALTGTHKSITAVRGEMLSIGAHGIVPAGQESEFSDTVLVKVLPTFHPSYVLRTPVQGQTVLADLGRAFRWFEGHLTWVTPEYVRQPRPVRLAEWIRDEKARTRAMFGRPRFVMDTETDGLEPLTARMRCFALSTPAEVGSIVAAGVRAKKGAHVIACNILSADAVTRFYRDVDEEWIRRIIREEILEDEEVDLFGHNIIGYDLRVLERYFFAGDVPVDPL